MTLEDDILKLMDYDPLLKEIDRLEKLIKYLPPLEQYAAWNKIRSLRKELN